MNTKKILIPLPSYGFDPTEVAIPWKILTANNFEVYFTTPEGKTAAADKRMLTGKGLGIWKKLLQARKDATDAYFEMEKNEAFKHPVKYSDSDERQFDALLLPGGHDKAVREYLESKILQQKVVDFFKAQKPVAAICHGVVLVARSINPENNKSVIYHYQTTALLKSQEWSAYTMTRLWLQDYYLTYPGNTVEDEVKAALSNPNQFIQGPFPLSRDRLHHLKRGFFVRDRNYLSARWPGDAYNFSLELVKMLRETER